MAEPKPGSPETIRLNWEEILSNCYGKITAEILEKFKGEDESKQTERIEREKSFTNRVLLKLREVIEKSGNKQIEVLFDIDKTLGQVYISSDGDEAVLKMRPSALILLDAIKSISLQLPVNIKMGIFSSRLSYDTDMRLNGQVPEDDLGQMSRYIDREMVYSTESVQDMAEHYDENMEDYSPLIFRPIDGSHPSVLSDKAFYENDGKFQYRPDMNHADKLHALQVMVGDQLALASDGSNEQMVNEYSKILSNSNLRRVDLDKECLMIVDDYDYVDYLNEQRGLFGVSVGGDLRKF